MAFIVEIFRSPQIKLTGVDMRMSGKTWETLQALAQEAGWRPAGTIKPPHWEGDYFIYKGQDQFVNDYKPAYPESKMVTAEDALAMATALENVKAKMISDQEAIEVKGPVILNEKLGAFRSDIEVAYLEKFIDYIKKDAFEFWWDD